MKPLVLFLTLDSVTPSFLSECCKAPEAQQRIQNEMQEEDKKALAGEFKKSEGKSY